MHQITTVDTSPFYSTDQDGQMSIWPQNTEFLAALFGNDQVFKSNGNGGCVAVLLSLCWCKFGLQPSQLILRIR